MIGIHTRRGEWDWGADGDIPHDQTDQSACWDAGAAQAGSTTPSISPSTGHKHMGTNRGTLRVCMLLCPAVPRLMTSEFPIRSSTGHQENGGKKTLYKICNNSLAWDRLCKWRQSQGLPYITLVLNWWTKRKNGQKYLHNSFIFGL